MATFLVAGLINIETTLQVDGFPIDYQPVRYPFFGVNTTVSGVGLNISKALTRLGHEVRLLSLVGTDVASDLVRAQLSTIGINDRFVLASLENTPQSVILYNPSGKRAINTDLKDIQEKPYPPGEFEAALAGVDLAVMCNVNFTRALLPVAKAQNVMIATDVHAIRDLHDAYNADYMRAADILFMSHENLPTTPEDWAQSVSARYQPDVCVVGIGAQGALLSLPSQSTLQRVPAVATRPVVNTIGAGDALFAAFLHSYVTGHDALTALRKAVVFASYKIGATGAAQGFLDAPSLDRLHDEMFKD